MFIGVIADSHDRLPTIDAAMKIFAERRVEAIIHAGDFVAPFAVKRLIEQQALDSGVSPDEHYPPVSPLGKGGGAAPSSRNAAAAIPIHAVYGNNDGERAGIKRLLPQVVDGPLHVELGGRRILVHHFIDWCTLTDIDRAEIIITGHTHEVVNRYERDKLFLNPGECCGWVNGRCTVAILETEGPSAEVFEL